MPACTEIAPDILSSDTCKAFVLRDSNAALLTVPGGGSDLNALASIGEGRMKRDAAPQAMLGLHRVVLDITRDRTRHGKRLDFIARVGVPPTNGSSRSRRSPAGTQD